MRQFFHALPSWLSVASLSTLLLANVSHAETVTTTWFDGETASVDISSGDSMFSVTKDNMTEYPEWDYHSLYLLAFNDVASSAVDSAKRINGTWSINDTTAVAAAADALLGWGNFRANVVVAVGSMVLDDEASARRKAAMSRWHSVAEPGLALVKIADVPDGDGQNQRLMDLAREGAELFKDTGIDCRFMEKKSGLIGALLGKSLHTAGLFRVYDKVAADVILANCPVRLGQKPLVYIRAHRIFPGHTLYKKYPNHVLVTAEITSMMKFDEMTGMKPDPVLAMVDNVKPKLGKDWYLMYTAQGSKIRKIVHGGTATEFALPKSPMAQ